MVKCVHKCIRLGQMKIVCLSQYERGEGCVDYDKSPLRSALLRARVRPFDVDHGFEGD